MTQSQSQPQYLTMAEVRALLHCNRITVWRLVKRGALHPKQSARDRRFYLFDATEVRALADGRVPMQEAQ